MENTGATLTGKASVDKPWLQFYPEALRNVEVPTITSANEKAFIKK